MPLMPERSAYLLPRAIFLTKHFPGHHHPLRDLLHQHKLLEYSEQHADLLAYHALFMQQLEKHKADNAHRSEAFRQEILQKFH